MIVQKTTAKLKKTRSWLITFYSYLHSIGNTATLHKRHDRCTGYRDWQIWMAKSNLLPNGAILSNVHLQICFSSPRERSISHSKTAHAPSLEYRKARAISVGVILLLRRVLRDFPHALVSHSTQWMRIFPQEISCLTGASIPSYSPLGKWMLWSAHSLAKHVLSLHLLVTYIFLILIGAESDLLEFLFQTVLDLGRTRYLCTTTRQ